MKLGIDISQIVYKGTGVARFTTGLVDKILQLDSKNQWTFFFSGLRSKLDEDLISRINSKEHRLIKWPLPPKALSFLFNDLHDLGIVPKELKELDLFITSDWTEPKLDGVKKATIIHDLVFRRYPETVEETILKTQTRRLTHVVKESDLVFADSAATKKDLLGYYNVENSKVVVNYPGVDVPRTSKKIQQNRPYILTVGKLEPRKNLKRLVSAFNKMNDPSLDLLIVGPKGWEQLGEEFKNPNIKVLEYVSDEKLYSLYAGCLFFVYPSLWEGFGIPVVEAMKMGTPVACSNTSSIAEVAGDSALTFDPTNDNEILSSLSKMKSDSYLRNSLSKKGVKNAKKFTWDNYYDKMMSSIFEVSGKKA